MFSQSDAQDGVVEQIYDNARAAAAAAVPEPSVSLYPEVRVRWHEMLVVDRDAGHGPGLNGVGQRLKVDLATNRGTVHKAWVCNANGVFHMYSVRMSKCAGVCWQHIWR